MKKKREKYTWLLLSTALITSGQILGGGEQIVKASVESQTNSVKKSKTAVEHSTTALSRQAVEAQLAAQGVNFERLTPEEQQEVYVDVIVQLEALPASENGSIDSQTASRAEIEQASNKVIAAQSGIKDEVQKITNQAIDKSYGYVVNGFATKAKVGDIKKLREIKGVKSVTLAKVYFAADTSANNMANVSTVWSNYQYKGEGTVVSIIDTGIDPNHKDLRLSDESKVKLTAKDIDGFTENSGYGRYFTSKVPFGHNYSDNNDIITDDDPKEQHGMHVAGIVAANGTGKNSASSVVGVAPEAQLLAMKAFSNSDSSSTTDSTSVIGAVDDSAKLGADVLNMSLGSVSGEQTEDDPEIAAVEKAVKHGTAAVISAGNSGTSTSNQEGVNKDFYGNPDMETIGSPGTSRSATTVASAENTKVTTDGMTVSTADGKKIFGPSVTQLSPNTSHDAFDSKKFYIVKDASGKLGMGTPSQYTADVKGKIAVVSRGEITFTDKQKYAQAAGAAGLIIVNNAGGNTPLTSVLYNEGFPTAGLSTDDGNKLVAYVEAHPDELLRVNVEVQPLNNVIREEDLMSSFTSYGPVSDLSFKPDITAPGGNIWSLQNNNGYINMSGTSMASPFIAGSQALLVQAMNDKTGKFYETYQKMSGSERAALIKNIQMNTANIEVDVDHGSVIESPRRQGAGLVNVEAAINAILHNPSTVSGSNGYPGVELKDFQDRQHQFTIKFTNRTNKDIEYGLNENGKFSDVYTSETDPKTGVLFEKKIDGASLTPSEKIVVPANSTKEVTINLSLPDNFKENQYVEGFMAFTGSDNSHLKIPYMGFFGDWAAPAIFDGLNGLAFNPGNNNFGTIVTAGNKNGAVGYAGLNQDEDGNYRVDPDAIALSTADGASVSWVRPQYFLFRNANDVKTEILNQDGEVINTLVSLAHVTKSYWAASSQRYAKFNYAPAWDGTYFNQQTNKTEKVPDGTYTYRVTGTVDGTKKQQHYDIKVKVDSVKPEVKNLKLGSHKDQTGKVSYVLKAEAKDNFSGLNGQANTYVNGELNRSVAYDIVGSSSDGYQKIEVPLSDEQVKTLRAGKNDLAIAVFDNATNAGTNSGTSNKPGEINFGLIIDNNLPQKITTVSDGYDMTDDSYTISGTYPEKVYGTYTDKDGKEHDLNISYDEASERFVTKLPLSVSDYDTNVKFYADEEHETLITQKRINVSLVPPKLESLKVDDQETYTGNEEAKLSQTSEDTVEVSGKVSDDTDKVAVKVAGKTYSAKPTKEHTFKVKVPVSYGENTMNIVLTDKDGNSSSVKQIVKSSDRGKTVVSAKDVTFDNGIKFGTTSVNTETENYDPKTGKLTLTGKVNRPTTTVRIGDHTVKVKADGTFKLVLDLGKHGAKVFPVLIGDTTVNDTVQERLTFYVDSNNPELTLNQEKDQSGYVPVYTNKEEFKLQGTISDDYPYYSLLINDNNVDANWDDVDYNGNKNLKKSFSHSVKLKEGKNTFNVVVVDNNDNRSEVQTLVVYYKKAQKLASPQITATTASDKKSVTVTGKAKDGNVLYSTDNGNKYNVLPEDGVTVKNNGKLLFKTVDKYGNESEVVEYDVKTIGKEESTVDKSVAQARKDLRKELDQARALGNTGKYTHESAKKLAQARQEASKALKDKNATLQELKQASEQLEEAIKNLVEKPVDQNKDKDKVEDKDSQVNALKEKLEETVKAGEKFDKDKYTDDSVEKVTKALDEAKVVLANKDANSTDVQDAIDSIVNATKSLKEKQVSPEKTTQQEDTPKENKDTQEVLAAKNALKEKADKLSHLDTTKYTSESAENLSNALKKVNQVLTNKDANKAQVQEALDSLSQAEKDLVEKTESNKDVETAKEQLREELNKHKDEDKSQYTDDSAKVKDNAEKTAEGVLDSKDAQADEVNKAKDSLVEAEKGLVKKEENKPAESDAQEVDKAREALEQEVNKNANVNLDGYTPESQDKFKEILNGVRDVLNDKNASASSLEKAEKVLETATGVLTQVEHQVELPKVEQPVVTPEKKQTEQEEAKKSESSSVSTSKDEVKEPEEKKQDAHSVSDKGTGTSVEKKGQTPADALSQVEHQAELSKNEQEEAKKSESHSVSASKDEVKEAEEKKQDAHSVSDKGTGTSVEKKGQMPADAPSQVEHQAELSKNEQRAKKSESHSASTSKDEVKEPEEKKQDAESVSDKESSTLVGKKHQVARSAQESSKKNADNKVPTHKNSNKAQNTTNSSTRSTKSSNNKELPKTGERETFFGLLVTGITALFASLGTVLRIKNKK